jgi:anti-sigma regulatory factor (Ser/Thr protein kinase)
VSGFRHEALFYEGEADYLARTVPFVVAGLSAGDAILVAVPEPGLSSLRTELGAAGAEVIFHDMAVIGRNPGRIISVWDDFIRARNGHGGALRGIGEPVWAKRSPDELVECQIHEDLLNAAFGHTKALRLGCPYDSTALPHDVVARARESHDHGPADPARALGAPLRTAPAGAHVEMFTAGGVRGLRHEITELARHVGLSAARTDDFVLAVNEVATNSIRHGGGSGTLRAWIDGEAVVCELSDDGHITDPLVGRIRPPIDAPGGRGLWLAHQLCDLVQVRSDSDGTVVRLRVDGGRVL